MRLRFSQQMSCKQTVSVCLGAAPMTRWFPCCRAVVPIPLWWWRRVQSCIRLQTPKLRRVRLSLALARRPSVLYSGWLKSCPLASGCTVAPSASSSSIYSRCRRDTPSVKLSRLSSSTGNGAVMHKMIRFIHSYEPKTAYKTLEQNTNINIT